MAKVALFNTPFCCRELPKKNDSIVKPLKESEDRNNRSNVQSGFKIQQKVRDGMPIRRDGMPIGENDGRSREYRDTLSNTPPMGRDTNGSRHLSETEKVVTLQREYKNSAYNEPDRHGSFDLFLKF